ncbi:hypothetical protein ACN28E_08295 [Archangium lansingense]|uniref:hypothetical protein n=1 Tax=Archangium lansingense TaxID=2995310 RepID=UPI003B801C83
MGLDLTFEFSESGDKAGPSASQPPAVTQVRLRRDWIRYQDSAGKDVILDFARRRRIDVDEAARTYVDESLYSIVGFRHMELPNRDHIHSVITAGGGDASDFAPIMTEHHLSVLDPERKRTIDGVKPTGLGGRLRSVFSKPARSDITVESTQGHTVFSTAEGRRLFAYSEGGKSVEPDIARRFVQFLRYRFYGHPLILERLASEGSIPREIRQDACHPQGMPYSTVTLRLKAVDAVPETVMSLDGYRRVMAPRESPEIDSALERVTLGEVPNPEEVMARRMAEAEESAKAGRRLEDGAHPVRALPGDR